MQYLLLSSYHSNALPCRLISFRHFQMESSFSNQTACKHCEVESIQIIGLQIFLCVLLETLGNGLLYAIIFYEKYGMDPQKRTLSNQLFSLLCGAFIFMNLFGIPLLLTRKMTLIPTKTHQVKIAAVLVLNGVIFFMCVTILEMLLSSLLQLTHFSRMAGIDEYFFTTWLLFVNVLLSILHTAARYLSGEIHENPWVCPGITRSHFHTQFNKW